jgi:hypothetical protein
MTLCDAGPLLVTFSRSLIASGPENGIDKFDMTALHTSFAALTVTTSGPHVQVALGANLFVVVTSAGQDRCGGFPALMGATFPITNQKQSNDHVHADLWSSGECRAKSAKFLISDFGRDFRMRS